MSPLTEAALDDRQLERYLLGLLPEEDAERLDELSITDDNVAGRLRIVEDDLVDAYVSGELAGELLERFESFYLSSERRRQKVKFARSFLATDRGAGPAGTAGHEPTQARPAGSHRISPERIVVVPAMAPVFEVNVEPRSCRRAVALCRRPTAVPGRPVAKRSGRGAAGECRIVQASERSAAAARRTACGRQPGSHCCRASKCAARSDSDAPDVCARPASADACHRADRHARGPATDRSRGAGVAARAERFH